MCESHLSNFVYAQTSIVWEPIDRVAVVDCRTTTSSFLVVMRGVNWNGKFDIKQTINHEIW